MSTIQSGLEYFHPTLREYYQSVGDTITPVSLLEPQMEQVGSPRSQNLGTTPEAGGAGIDGPQNAEAQVGTNVNLRA
jgi:hypothetical protein